MKTLFVKVVLLANFLLVANVLLAQTNDRNVIWVHGLREDATTWDTYESIFDNARQINGASPGYNSYTLGLSGSANNTYGDMTSAFGATGISDPQNIGIGHSMGGVVLREMDRRQSANPQRLGGIITVGSPNKGTAIVNNIESGMVDAAIDDACIRLSAGPLSMVPVVNWNIGNWSSAAFCQIMTDEIFNEALGAALDVSQPGPQDLKQGSAAIATVNNYNSTIPRISIWGNEESPSHWRIASSIISNNANDQDVVNDAIQVRQFYTGMSITQASVALVTGLLSVIKPPLAGASALSAWQSVQWGRGAQWIRTSETVWNALIGCNQQQSYTYTYETTIPGNCQMPYSMNIMIMFFPELIQDYIDCLSNCASTAGCLQTVTVTQTVLTRNESDGFICKGSQIMDGLPQNNIYEARGVNHFEQTNTTQSRPGGDDVMGTTFNLIWDRPLGDFFKTATR